MCMNFHRNIQLKCDHQMNLINRNGFFLLPCLEGLLTPRRLHLVIRMGFCSGWIRKRKHEIPGEMFKKNVEKFWEKV